MATLDGLTFEDDIESAISLIETQLNNIDASQVVSGRLVRDRLPADSLYSSSSLDASKLISGVDDSRAPYSALPTNIVQRESIFGVNEDYYLLKKSLIPPLDGSIIDQGTVGLQYLPEMDLEHLPVLDNAHMPENLRTTIKTVGDNSFFVLSNNLMKIDNAMLTPFTSINASLLTKLDFATAFTTDQTHLDDFLNNSGNPFARVKDVYDDISKQILNIDFASNLNVSSNLYVNSNIYSSNINTKYLTSEYLVKTDTLQGKLDYSYLRNIPAGAQSDWNIKDNTREDYIKNKPIDLSQFQNKGLNVLGGENPQLAYAQMKDLYEIYTNDIRFTCNVFINSNLTVEKDAFFQKDAFILGNISASNITATDILSSNIHNTNFLHSKYVSTQYVLNEELLSNKATIGDLAVTHASIINLSSPNATIENLNGNPYVNGITNFQSNVYVNSPFYCSGDVKAASFTLLNGTTLSKTYEVAGAAASSANSANRQATAGLIVGSVLGGLGSLFGAGATAAIGLGKTGWAQLPGVAGAAGAAGGIGGAGAPGAPAPVGGANGADGADGADGETPTLQDLIDQGLNDAIDLRIDSWMGDPNNAGTVLQSILDSMNPTLGTLSARQVPRENHRAELNSKIFVDIMNKTAKTGNLEFVQNPKVKSDIETLLAEKLKQANDLEPKIEEVPSAIGPEGIDVEMAQADTAGSSSAQPMNPNGRFRFSQAALDRAKRPVEAILN